MKTVVTYTIFQPGDHVWILIDDDTIREGDVCQCEIDLYLDSDDAQVNRTRYIVLSVGDKGTTTVLPDRIFDTKNDAVIRLGEIVEGSSSIFTIAFRPSLV